MCNLKMEFRAFQKACVRTFIIITAALHVIILTSCSGRVLKDDVKKCENISVVSYTSNSWYHWGEDDPAMGDSVKVMAYDLISITADQSLNHKISMTEINEKMKKGDLVPGFSSSNYGMSELKRIFSAGGIKYNIRLSEPGESKDNKSYTVVSSEILSALANIIPADYAEYIENINEYSKGLDPYGRSAAEGMKLLYINDIGSGFLTGVKEITRDPGECYLVVNAVYVKQGLTVFGTGSAEVNCTLNAVLYNSDGIPLWKSTVDADGSPFAVASYFAFSWKSVEDSVNSATTAAVNELSAQLIEDLKNISVR